MTETRNPIPPEFLEDKQLAEDVARDSNSRKGARIYRETIPPMVAKAEREGDAAEVKKLERIKRGMELDAKTQEGLRIRFAQEIAPVPFEDLPDLREEVEYELSSLGIKTDAIHSNLPDGFEQRLHVIRDKQDELRAKLWAINRRVDLGN